MIARSGNMQMAPIVPVKVVGGRSGCGAAVASRAFVRAGTMEGSGTGRKRDIVTYGHPRTQGSDRPSARAARGVSLLQRRGRHDLRGEGARPPRPRAQLSG